MPRPGGRSCPRRSSPVYRNVPANRAGNAFQLTLHPLSTVVPVGSEVIVLAGGLTGISICEPISESSDARPGRVGFFVDFNRRTLNDWLVLDSNRPQKISNTYAIGSTSRQNLRLTRGTPNPADDVLVLSGQAWISVTSPSKEPAM